MNYDAVPGGHGLALDPFKALVAPRPIAWISTDSAEGAANLAPYSFFNAFGEAPYYLAFGSGGRKDTLANIEATGEFCVNMVNAPLAEAMNATSAGLPHGMDEFAFAGLAKAACVRIAPPRVAAAPAAFECVHHQTVPLPDVDGTTDDFLVIGRVVHIHIDDRYLKDGRVDAAAMQLVARFGYAEYATVKEVWRMRRPA